MPTEEMPHVLAHVELLLPDRGASSAGSVFGWPVGDTILVAVAAFWILRRQRFALVRWAGNGQRPIASRATSCAPLDGASLCHGSVWIPARTSFCVLPAGRRSARC